LIWRRWPVVLSSLFSAGLQEKVDVSRLKLPTGQGLTKRRQPQNRSQYCRHGSVAQLSLVVKDEILQFASLNCHQDNSMDRVDRSDYTVPPWLQVQGTSRARRDTDSATQASFFVNPSQLPFGFTGIIGGDKRHGFHGTNLHALATSVTEIELAAGYEVGRVNWIEQAEPSGSNHRLATTSTAVADEGDSRLDVVTKLDQSPTSCLLQQVQCFPHFHWPGDTVSYE